MCAVRLPPPAPGGSIATIMNSSASKPKVAFLGLGIMGSGMARRLLGAGFPMTVYNRTPEKASSFASEGATAVGSPREAATGADVIITMLADDPAARGIWLDDHGALAGAGKGALLIECSTVTPGWVVELSGLAAQRGCEFLDAPVTGSKKHAAGGELNFLVGGTAAALERARPLLSVMGRNIVHVGPTGSGAQMKLINNFMCGVQAASLAEALVLIERMGLDITKAGNVVVDGTPGSLLVKTLWPRMTAHDFAPNFPLGLMTKDLTYSLQEAERHGCSLPMVARALDIFKQAVAEGHGADDFSSVVEPARKKGGKK